MPGRPPIGSPNGDQTPLLPFGGDLWPAGNLSHGRVQGLGATNAVAVLRRRRDHPPPVFTAGAYAARRQGVAVTVVMPTPVPRSRSTRSPRWDRIDQALGATHRQELAAERPDPALR
jgi:hypothetical protein